MNRKKMMNKTKSRRIKMGKKLIGRIANSLKS